MEPHLKSHVSVLVVDDEPLIRMYAADVLNDAGYEVVEAETGAGALEALGRRPDITVLFSDVNMPGDFDGLALARRVHAIRPDIRIVITSGAVRPTGADLPDEAAFVAKPYTPEAITRAIAMAA